MEKIRKSLGMVGGLRAIWVTEIFMDSKKCPYVEEHAIKY